jgi:hypothetical protein
MGCCGSRKKMMGNIIFRPIDQKIEKCGDKEFDEMFDKIAMLINKAEDLRGKIAGKFKNMIIETGSCVLRRPTIERSVSSFVLQIFIEVNKDIKGDTEKLKKFNFKSLFEFKISAPYFSFNQKSISELKSSLNVSLDDNPELVKGKKAIFEFIESLNLFKDFFVDMSNQISILYNQSYEFFKQIKNKLTSSGKDGITIKQATDIVTIAERNLEHTLEVTGLITIMNSFIFETVQAIATLADNIMHPREILNLQNIATDAYQKKIFTPKEIVFKYSKYEKCDHIDDWQENICYKEDGQEDELRF